MAIDGFPKLAPRALRARRYTPNSDRNPLKTIALRQTDGVVSRPHPPYPGCAPGVKHMFAFATMQCVSRTKWSARPLSPPERVDGLTVSVPGVEKSSIPSQTKHLFHSEPPIKSCRSQCSDGRIFCVLQCAPRLNDRSPPTQHSAGPIGPRSIAISVPSCPARFEFRALRVTGEPRTHDTVVPTAAASGCSPACNTASGTSYAGSTRRMTATPLRNS